VLVVLDTNIFISALLTPAGLARRVVKAGIAGTFEYALCPKLLGEIDDVTRRPHIASALIDTQDFVADVQSGTRIEPDPSEPPLSRDPEDDYLVALALAIGADHLVTGDADLLELDHPLVPITGLRTFADLLGL